MSTRCIVLSTAPTRAVARKLANIVLAKKLVACVQIIPGLESHYWWKGKMEKSAEWLLIMKTEKRKVAALQKSYLAAHPYEIPEFVVVPILSGSRAYLDWISVAVQTARIETGKSSHRLRRRVTKAESRGPDSKIAR